MGSNVKLAAIIGKRYSDIKLEGIEEINNNLKTHRLYFSDVSKNTK